MRKPLRAALLVLLLLNVLLFVVAMGRHPKPTAKPRNVVLISIDALRADQLGKGFSPNLDRVAAAGTTFTHAYTQGSSTFISHASMFCGKYPFNIPAWHEPHKLPDSWKPLAELLRDDGYDTAAFTGDAWVAGQWGFNRGFRVLSELEATFARNFSSAAEWIEKGRVADHPFFVFVHAYDVHPPHPPASIDICGVKNPSADVQLVHQMLADPRFYRKIKKGVYYKGARADIYPTPTLETDDPIPLSEEARKHLILHYQLHLQRSDEAFGAFMGTLQKLGLADDTLIVVIGDHGWDFFEHGFFMHGVHGFRSIANVPLVFSGPGVRAARVDDFVQLVDVPPTVLDYVGAVTPKGLDGADLKGVLVDGQAPPRETAITLAADGMHLRAFGFDRVYTVDHQVVDYDMTADPDGLKPVTQVSPDAEAAFKAALPLVGAAAMQAMQESLKPHPGLTR